jgi:hypothetical protein
MTREVGQRIRAMRFFSTDSTAGTGRETFTARKNSGLAFEKN